MFKNFLYIVLNPLFCALASCRSEGVFIDFIYNSTDSYNYYYLSFGQGQQPESGGFFSLHRFG